MTSHEPTPSDHRPVGLRVTPFVLGGLGVIAHYSLADQVVFRSELGKSFLYLSWRESLFWLSHYLLLVPGLVLMFWGAAPRIGDRLVGLWREGVAWMRGPAGRRGVLLAVFGTLLFTASFVGRKVLLLDLPVTNDEYTLNFGADILAAGEVTAPDIDPAFGLTMPYVYRNAGRISSMDFPGTMLVLAAGKVTGLGFSLTALLVALSGVALVASCRRLDGARGTWVAALTWLLAPMVWTLSMTEHSQLMSRIWIAFAWAVWIGCFWRRSEDRVVEAGDPVSRPWVIGSLLGLATAMAFISRPAETGMVMAPVAAHLLSRAWRFRRLGIVVSAGAAASLGPLFLLWWNLQTSGRWNVSARVLSNRTMGDPFWDSLFHRVGGNIGFNVMMLMLWFVGPAIVALVLAAWRPGSAGRSGLAALCGVAIALELLLAIFHSDTGNHLVGPIHYAECAVPLLVLTVLGWRRLARWLDDHGGALHLTPATLASFIAAYIVGLVLWSFTHNATLLDQALVQRYHLDAVADLENAVVIADRPYKLWFARPEIGGVSSWVAELPHPDPYLRDEVLFAYPEADLEALRRAFPDRRLYRMTYAREGDPVRVVPLDGR
ncbi:MAG: hypothetical protein MPN21_23925 [Thermoanaerobaculia bacterium]|nr:hypothetical protein [Thermoanaerobaculia bacterium]